MRGKRVLERRESTLAGKIVELHSGEEIGWPFGPPLPRSVD